MWGRVREIGALTFLRIHEKNGYPHHRNNSAPPPSALHARNPHLDVAALPKLFPKVIAPLPSLSIPTLPPPLPPLLPILG